MERLWRWNVFLFLKMLQVYNKVDQISIEEVDRLARQSNSVVISCGMKLNLDYLLEQLWEYLALICLYTKKRGGHSAHLHRKKNFFLLCPAPKG